jgi:hypothetical protein
MLLQIRVISKYRRNTRAQVLAVRVESNSTVSLLIDVLDELSVRRHQWLHRKILTVCMPGVGNVVLDPQMTWEELGAENGWVVHVHIPGMHNAAGAA